MSPVASLSPEEIALRNFLAPLPEAVALKTRTLAHAWTAAGGRMQVGKLTIRLVATRNSKSFTAATLHAGGRLELSRVLLLANGLTESTWADWSDERPELRTAGFDATTKYPSVTLAKLTDTGLARLAVGLRDIVLAIAKA